MFFAIKNLASSVVFELPEPWTTVPKTPYSEFGAKTEFADWCQNPATDHIFFSGIEGLTPVLRVSSGQNKMEGGNPPHAMHAVVYDYDGQWSDDLLTKVLTKPPTEYFPAFVASTFSGHVRAVWLFESSVLLPHDPKCVNAFLKIISKRLKAHRWFAGWDEDAAHRAEQYYELGMNWKPACPSYRIPAVMVQTWLSEAARMSNFRDWDDGLISMDVVKEELERRYPGEINGQAFIEGARFKRFWDSSAKNESAAILHRDGFQCFSGDKPFVTWRDLFGTAWIDKHSAAKIGELRKDIYFENESGNFYAKDPQEGFFVKKAVETLREDLRCRGFSSSITKGKTSSQIDNILNDIRNNHRIDGAAPFILMEPGIITLNTKKMLNTSRIKVITPSSDKMTGIWDEDGPKFFPFIHGVMSSLFNDPEEPFDQLGYLLCWMKRFYTGGYKLSPVPGQALFVGGPTGKGKTVLGQVIIAGLMGGCTDASSWLSGDSPWTAGLIQFPLFLVDDSTPGDNQYMLIRFTSLVKKVVANRLFPYNGKWQVPGDTLWNGRVLVLFNLDTLSERILPAIDTSNADKISMLKVADTAHFQYPEEQSETAAKVTAELPQLGRFLLTMAMIPEFKAVGDNRYGIKAVRHPDLHQDSLQSGRGQQVYELLQMWMSSWKNMCKGQDAWVGTVSELYCLLSATDGAASGIMPRNVYALKEGLGSLSSRGFGIKRLPVGEDGLQRYAISTTLASPMISNPAEEIAMVKASIRDGYRTPSDQILKGSPCESL